MSKAKWLVLMAAVAAMGISIGCESSDDDDDGGDGGGGTVTGSYAGTWTGNVCGRGLTMVINQSGTSLSGTYTFTDPTFNGTFSGTATSATPPATAHLVCGSGHEDWWFDLSFASYNQMTGGFYKTEKGGKVCDINAVK